MALHPDEVLLMMVYQLDLTRFLAPDVGGPAAASAGVGRERRRRAGGVEERQQRAAIRVVRAARWLARRPSVRCLPGAVHAGPGVRGPAVRGAGAVRLAVCAAWLWRRVPARAAAAATLPRAWVRAARLSVPPTPPTSTHAATPAYDGAVATAS